MVMLPHSLRGLRRLFGTLDTMSVESLEGGWERRYVGPLLARDVTPLAYRLTGVDGWWGCRFDAEGIGTTLHGSRSEPEERHPLRVRAHDSDLDRRASVIIELPITAGPLWRRVTEEPRRLDEKRALVMAVLELPIVGAQGWPFLYERVS